MRQQVNGYGAESTFPRGLAYGVISYKTGRLMTKAFIGVTSQANLTREAPAQGRVENWRGDPVVPFPDPAHQTGCAILPRPAFGQGCLCFRPRQVSRRASQTEQAQAFLQILVTEALVARGVQLMLLA